ncbi:unnamed protein product [Symbiodinium pilosum]|uniref:PROP1-like PPR domain-containing protein n=1 Tax=Symbiodinium pilosum TaxID=2952 RepID=A0A812U9Y8_SYMPI|nr:unnamed protein product [Symbiodinium pilosum]
METKRTTDAQEATESRRNDARERLQKERQTAGVHTTVMEEDCSCMVRRVELREEATRRRLEEFTEGPVTALERTTQLWHKQSDRKSLCDKVSLEQTAWVLGHHFKSRWNYTPSVDDKVANILQGCLHGRTFEPDLTAKTTVGVHMAFLQPCLPALEVGYFEGDRRAMVCILVDLRCSGFPLKGGWQANLAGVAVGVAALHSQAGPAARGASKNLLRRLRVEQRSQLDDRKVSNLVEEPPSASLPDGEDNIEALLSEGQTEAARALVEDMVANMVTPSTSSYSSVINACSKEGRVDDAALLLAKLKAMEVAPDVVSHGSVIEGFAKAGRPEDIGRLMDDMDEDGVEVDVVMHNSMIKALLQTGRVDDAFDWLVSMMAPQAADSERPRSPPVRPNKWSYNLVVRALAKQGRSGAVSALLKTMDQMQVEPSIQIHDRILRGLLSAGKKMEAYRWLRQTIRMSSTRSGLEYDTQFVTVALDVCMKTGNYAEAFAWLSGMQDAGLDPPTEGRGAASFFVKAVTVCAKANKLADGLDWLQRAESLDLQVEPDQDGRASKGPRGIPLRTAYVVLMQAFARARDKEEAKDLLVRLEEQEGRIDLMARTTLIEELSCHGNPKEARDMANKLQEDGNLSVYMFGRVISACAKADQADEAIKWFDNMVTFSFDPDAVAWNGIINACARVGRVAEAEMWLGEMEASGVTPDVFSYTTVINACAQTDRPQEAKRWLTQMQEAKVNPNAVTYSSTINALTKANQVEDAIEVLVGMEEASFKPDASAYARIITGLARSNRDMEAAAWLQTMTEANHSPNTPVYNWVISACKRKRNPDLAESMMRQMLANGHMPNNFSVNSLRVLLGKERFQQLQAELPRLRRLAAKVAQERRQKKREDEGSDNVPDWDDPKLQLGQKRQRRAPSWQRKKFDNFSEPNAIQTPP